MLSSAEREKLLSEVLDKDKVTLVCGIHKRGYGDKRPPVFRCKQCMMVEFLGLLVNTPEEKRLELVDAIEHMVGELVQADKEGRIDRHKLFSHPKITIQREDGRVFNYNENSN